MNDHIPPELPRTRKPLFQPLTRGDISKALERPTNLQRVAPESPRPAEMLTGVTIDAGGVDLTGSDIALHELLIAKAYETDRSMAQTSYEIPMSECLRFLGPDARSEHVRTSLSRLKRVELSFGGENGRAFSGVPMLTPWTSSVRDTMSVGYQFADPIRWLMRSMPAYGYVELAAIGQGEMRSKYSQMLYKHLAFHAAQRRWSEEGDNRIELSYTPSELATIVGFATPTGDVPFGKFNERVLSRIAEDFAGVRKFDVYVSFDGELKPRRSVTVQRIGITLMLRPDSHHTVRQTDFALKKHGRVGAPDDPRYRVNSVVWPRAARRFGSLGLTHASAWAAWLVALQEALDELPMGDDYDTRRFRGKALLAGIDAHGAEAAAWGFFAEEADLGPVIVGSLHVLKRLPVADKSRVSRVNGAKKRKSRRQDKKIGNRLPIATTIPFDTVSMIQLQVDAALTDNEIDDLVDAPLRSRQWTGSKSARKVTIRLRWAAGYTDIHAAPADEAEMMSAIAAVDQYIVGAPEYVAEVGK
ncbi:hypothetical protein [Rhizobium ruizarguesonis]|uniref:hypothetical protein n=1 Tax=Rhizobium ruizarguesonis TaxID=2081791 RepID=UPI001030F6CF|nr:hypothetical protein [Rhizobium ruizarguesonis]TAT77153.1 hypothetical protein ELI56_02450 [Rhizobium ruizarguesonis]TBD19871.1 hypothetical protein ELH23_02415 [Rhizobium ruizarguesonis]